MSEKQAYPEPDPTLSSDATHSTYEPAPEEEGYPKPGPGVIQTKGKPKDTGGSEAEAKPARATRSSGAASNTST